MRRTVATAVLGIPETNPYITSLTTFLRKHAFCFVWDKKHIHQYVFAANATHTLTLNIYPVLMYIYKTLKLIKTL